MLHIDQIPGFKMIILVNCNKTKYFCCFLNCLVLLQEIKPVKSETNSTTCDESLKNKSEINKASIDEPIQISSPIKQVTDSSKSPSSFSNEKSKYCIHLNLFSYI